jgi:predicted metal-dependent phosphoesterase TrpH
LFLFLTGIMLSSLNADLHSHSTRSDGVLTPSALAERAKRNGVELWALTDHDEVSGIAEARAAAADLRMPFIAGVEVSVTWAGKTVHIVGLGIDENNADLKKACARPVQAVSAVRTISPLNLKKPPAFAAHMKVQCSMSAILI